MSKRNLFLILSFGIFFVTGCVATSIKKGSGRYNTAPVLIPAGEFLMGSPIQEGIGAGEFLMGSLPKEGVSDEYPQHKVILANYFIDRIEVTNAKYKQCVDAEKCTPPHNIKFYDDPDYAEHPVVYVDWFQAKAYCEWKENRLPTEAEWEKAASWDDENKKKLKYPWGDNTPDCSYANYGGCSGETKEVASFEKGKSPYGVYDMAGNVWEWVNDWYDEGYYKSDPSENPRGPGSGKNRVLRGGSWFYGAYFMRSANRIGDNPANKFDFRGFRCAFSK